MDKAINAFLLTQETKYPKNEKIELNYKRFFVLKFIEIDDNNKKKPFIPSPKLVATFVTRIKIITVFK